MGIFRRIFGKKEESDQLLDFKDQMPDPTGEKPVVPEQSTYPSPDLPPHLEDPGLAPTMPKAETGQRDLELINSKLDTLKAILGSMDQRIANLEKAAGVEKKSQW